MSKYCVKKPFTVLVAVVMVIVLGVISFTKITTDLLPSISFPYVMAVTSYPGASPEKVEKSVTEQVERSLGRVNKVKNVSSISQENMSMVMLEFEENTNMDSAMVKLSTAAEKVRESLPEEASAPMLLEISPDMMATMTVGISYDGKDIRELSRFVNKEILPKLEREEGVASAEAIGGAIERVEIRINESKVNAVNDSILSKMDVSFARAESALAEKEGELKAATEELKVQKEKLSEEETRTYDELITLSQAIDEMVATSASYSANLQSLKTSRAALEKEKQGLNDALEQMPGIPMPDITKRISEIDAELNNLNTQIVAAEVSCNAINGQIESAKNNYRLVEQGKLSAAAAMGAAKAEMSSGSAKLAEAQGEMNKARGEYEKTREDAIASAGIDKLLDITTLSQLIYAQNFEMPAGYMEDKDNKVLLKVGNSFSSLKELEDMMLLEMDGIGKVRIGDVADVIVTDNSADSYAKIDGNDAVVLNITKSSVAGTSDVSKTLNKSISELEEKYDGLHFTMLMDQGAYIGLIINAILKNLIIGALLAIIVLAFFLKDFKPTVVVAFSIPLSVLFAVVLMYFSGVSVNLISLSGLALGVGMLVDNSIVVIENIYRLRQLGIPAPKAAVMGAKQVAGAIFASTLTTICVFLPIVFTDGMTRELFTDMALTMAYSLLASLVVALTFVPSMSSTLLKNAGAKEHRLFDRMLVKYEKALNFCLKKKIIPLAVAVILLVISAAGAGRMGMEMIPQMSGGYIGVSMEMDDELSQEEIYEKVDSFNEKILDVEGVETIGAMSGNGMMMQNDPDRKKTEFTLFVQLEEGKEKMDKKISSVIEREAEKEKAIKELLTSSNNMDMSALGGSGMEVKIEGENLEEMLEVSQDIMSILGETEGFTEISNGQEEGSEAVRLVLDKDKLMKEGLTVAGVYSEIGNALKTENAAVTLSLNGDDYEVAVVDENNRLTKDNILDFRLEGKGADGKEYSAVLGDFATIEEAPSVSAISRDNQARYITVSATTEEGYNTALLSRDAEKSLKEYKAPEGISVEVVGEIMNIKDMMTEMFKMMALAIAFIYMIMVAQFQSLLSPFIVLFTIPLAFTGGLLALWMSGDTISMIAMMGFLVLAGVVVNNGIVFVDYVNQLRLSGSSKHDALVEAGKTRMRPILMTALTTILAMSTMAFSREVTAEMSRGMAMVTIGGLAYATLMTLFIVPVLYDILFRRELKEVDVDTDLIEE